MRHHAICLLVGSLLIGSPIIAGCDKTVEEKKTVQESSDGTRQTDTKKVTESPNGTVTKTEEQHTEQK